MQFGGRIVDTAGYVAHRPISRSCSRVIGAGASGTEVASAFGRLGTEVILLEALDQVLPLEDPEIARSCEREIDKQNVTIVTGAKMRTPRGRRGREDRRGGRDAEVDYLVIAAGRATDIEGLGLDDAGLETDERGLIEVDGALRTTIKGIWAIGDLVRGPAPAHKASDEGIIAVEDAAGMHTHPIAYPDIPAVTFCYHRSARSGSPRRRPRSPATTWWRQGPDRRRRRAARLRQPRRDDEDRGEKLYGELLGGQHRSAKAANLIEELVIARNLEGGYPEVARFDPSAPGVRRGRDGSRPRHGRLANPRLSR